MKQLLLLALLPLSATATDQAAMCTNYAETLISGGIAPCGLFMCDADDWAKRIAKAGISCEPMQPYLDLAKTRLELRALQPRRPAYVPPPVVPYMFPQAPRRTVCNTYGGQTVCTTTGG